MRLNSSNNCASISSCHSLPIIDWIFAINGNALLSITSDVTSSFPGDGVAMLASGLVFITGEGVGMPTEDPSLDFNFFAGGEGFAN